MASLGGMHTSEILNNEIFKKQPGPSELQEKITAMLAWLSPKKENSPEVQGALNRIGSISETLTSLAGDTRAGIVSLYIEMATANHLSDYSNKVAILESHQRNRIAAVLGASNDENYSQAA